MTNKTKNLHEFSAELHWGFIVLGFTWEYVILDFLKMSTIFRILLSVSPHFTYEMLTNTYMSQSVFH